MYALEDSLGVYIIDKWVMTAKLPGRNPDLVTCVEQPAQPFLRFVGWTAGTSTMRRHLKV